MHFPSYCILLLRILEHTFHFGLLLHLSSHFCQFLKATLISTCFSLAVYSSYRILNSHQGNTVTMYSSRNTAPAVPSNLPRRYQAVRERQQQQKHNLHSNATTQAMDGPQALELSMHLPREPNSIHLTKRRPTRQADLTYSEPFLCPLTYDTLPRTKFRTPRLGTSTTYLSVQQRL